MPVRVELRRDVGRIGPMAGPWIRRRQIARIHGAPDPHELAQVVDRRGDCVGWGLISAVSKITVRLLCFGDEPPPATWLPDRLAAAFQSRQSARFEDDGTTGYRLVNSEGDGLPGLVVDRYGDDLVAQITTAPVAARESEIVQWLREQWSGPIHVVLPDPASQLEGFDAAIRRDGERSVLAFREHGLHFETPAPPHQKTGAFFDQRENRRIVAQLAYRHGGPLLDVGCHVGGFAIHARKLGVDVVGVDQSAVAREFAARNADTNLLGEIPWVDADMFGALADEQLKGPFGTIVFDPPKLAARKGDVDRALGAMRRAAQRLAPRVARGGRFVLCSCSHHVGRDHLDRLMAELTTVRRRWTRVLTLGAGLDHPVMPGHREGEYLRVNLYEARD